MTHRIFYSKYNDLSKIYDINSNQLITVIPTANHYYDLKKIKKGKFKNISNYSILGFKTHIINNNDYDKAFLVKLKSGFIALKIPYMKLLRLYNDDLR